MICITLVSDILLLLTTVNYSLFKHGLDAFSLRRLVPGSFLLGKLVMTNRVNRKASEICHLDKLNSKDPGPFVFF